MLMVQVVCPDGRSVWVDAINPKYSNWMRYVNCARCKNSVLFKLLYSTKHYFNLVEQEQNTIGLLYHQNIYYYTYKPIPANVEMMGKY